MLVPCIENYEFTKCHLCGALIDDDLIWSAIDQALDGLGPTDLAFTTPCCQAPTSLNDLDYSFPQGFARVSIGAVDTQRGWFAESELERLGLALGHSVRQIFQHS